MASLLNTTRPAGTTARPQRLPLVSKNCEIGTGGSTCNCSCLRIVGARKGCRLSIKHQGGGFGKGERRFRNRLGSAWGDIYSARGFACRPAYHRSRSGVGGFLGQSSEWRCCAASKAAFAVLRSLAAAALSVAAADRSACWLTKSRISKSPIGQAVCIRLGKHRTSLGQSIGRRFSLNAGTIHQEELSGGPGCRRGYLCAAGTSGSGA